MVAKEVLGLGKIRFIKILDNIEDPFFIVDNSYNIIYANRSFKKSFNFNAIGKKCYKLVHKNSKPLFNCPFLRLKKTKKVERVEYYDHVLNRWLQVTAIPLVSHNKIIGVAHFIKDVTSLKKEELLLRAAVENVRDILFTMDRKGVITYISPQCVQYGYNPNQIIGKRFVDFVVKEDKEKVLKPFLQTMKTGKTTQSIFRIKSKKDGKLIWMQENDSIIRDNKGRVIGLVGAMRDVTEEIKAKMKENKRKQYIELLAGFPRENPNPIIRLNKQKKIIYANESGKRFLTWASDGSIKLPKEAMGFVNKALKSYQKIIFEMQKSNRYYRFLVVPVKETGFLTFYGTEITELKLKQKKLKDAEELFKELYKISMSLHGSTKEVLDAITKEVHNIFGGFFVLVNHAQGSSFHFRSSCKLPKRVLKIGKENIRGAVCSHVLETKKPLFANNLQHGKCPFCNMPYNKDPAVKAFNLNSYMGVPLIYSDGSVHGTLCIVYKEKKEQFSESDTEILTLFAKRIAIELEREDNQKKLQAEKDKATNYLKIAGMIVALDRDGKVTLVNDEACKILGYTEKELLGKDWLTTCLPVEYQKTVKKVFHLLMAGKVKPVENYENPVVTKTGLQRDIFWHNTIIRDGKEIVGILSSGVDVTEKNRLEKELKEHVKELETFKKFAVNRELKMIELKAKIKELEAKLGEKSL